MDKFELWLKNEVGIEPETVKNDPKLSQIYGAIWREIEK